jgi:transposase
MPSQSWVCATAAQVEELRLWAGSGDREEADRARAILLSLAGWTGERIAAAFCVRPDSVRRWRWIFGRDGIDGLRGRKAPGPKKGRAALSVLEEVLASGLSEGANWRLPRLQEEIARRTGERLSKSRLSVVLQKGGSPGAAPGTR